MKSFIFLLIVLAGTAALAHAQVARTDSAAKARWAEFNQENESSLKVVWDQSSGRFSKMLGTTRPFGSSPDQAVSHFIDRESALLGITGSHNLSLKKRNESRRGQKTFVTLGYVMSLLNNKLIFPV